ncbi:MAG: transcriptional regulator NrdR [Candidatus Peribacteria bacterium]|jgi:transcriptional repressor NrdR|nr:transcriptional regulator NrdR [Candidatus Peribacteria bacterium]
MRCGKCKNADSKVIDSRIIDNGQTIRRRRECEFCGFRFTTFERVGITDLMVIKKDGSKEMYDRLKLKKAILLAFAKTNSKSDDIDDMLNTLEIKRQFQGNEITSKQIGDDVLDLLKQDYPVAYVRFASVYKSFAGLEDFKNLIG